MAFIADLPGEASGPLVLPSSQWCGTVHGVESHANCLEAFGARLLKPALRQFTRPLRPLFAWRKATYAGIQVHFKREPDGGGTSFGQDFIGLLQARGMPKQARCFEWCAGPGFIEFSLLGHGLCQELCLADINPDAVEACRLTVAANALDQRVSVYQSDNLSGIPAAEQWDLVVSNPPHFVYEFVGELRSYDRDWHIHHGFLNTVAAHLKPNGVIVLQENNRGSTAETFRDMIVQAGLSIVFVDGCAPERTQDHRFYFIGIMRRGDTPSAWAQERVAGSR